MRTTAATRPAEETWTARAAAGELTKRGLDRDTAIRVVSIAGAFGIKGECIPGGGVVTVKLVPGRAGAYTIHDKLFI